MGRRQLRSADIDDGDRLLDTIRVIGALDTLDSMDRREQQAAMEAKQMEMRLKEFQLNETQEARLASQQKFNVEQQIGKNIKEARSNSALAAINQQLPNLDFNSPEHEAQYGKLKSFAREHFVDDQGMQTTFGAYDEVMGRKKAERNTLQASELGEEGYAVYDALLKYKPDLDTSKALRLVKNSEKAKALYFWWQDYAAKNGVAFAPDANDQASLTKKIGADDSTATPVLAGSGNLQQSQSFDLREEVWDLQAVNNLVAKYVTPKLADIEKRKVAADALWQNDQIATTESKRANAAQSQTSAQKTATETAILKARNPDVYPSPQAAQAGGDTDQATSSPTLQNGIYKIFNTSPAPTPTPPGP
jgi:hypothetical protein